MSEQAWQRAKEIVTAWVEKGYFGSRDAQPNSNAVDLLQRLLAALPPDCGRGGALDWLLDALEQNEKGLSSNTQAAINAVRAAIPPAPGAAPQEPTQKRAFEDVPSLHGVVLDHFAKFADEPRPTMPEGYAAPLDARPVRQLIAEREAGAAPAPSARGEGEP